MNASTSATAEPAANALEFIRFALEVGVLRFGEFRTKAGRLSPYFFNAGLFNDGSTLGTLARFYAARLARAEAREGLGRIDMLFGPAYKGITLASATAVALAADGRRMPFAYNRKEAKDHGEGGTVVGAPLVGRVAIVDDVISAGTSVRESVEIIRSHGATPAAVLIALDRQERGGDATHVSALSASEEVQREFGIPVIAIAGLDDLFDYLDRRPADPASAAHRTRITDYRARFGTGRAT
ncbi:MAG: orotate phosphoribosyltransferase [Lautropia sp.]